MEFYRSYTPINGLFFMGNWGHDPYKLVVYLGIASKPEVGGMAWWDQANVTSLGEASVKYRDLYVRKHPTETVSCFVFFFRMK